MMPRFADHPILTAELDDTGVRSSYRWDAGAIACLPYIDERPQQSGSLARLFTAWATTPAGE